MSEPYLLEGEFKYQTDLAILVNDGDNDHWIPKSQIEEDIDWGSLDKGDDIQVTIPEWLAEEKGLV
jgi:hypothetical protein